MAFTLGFTRLICLRWACITSREESFFWRIRSAISRAGMKQISKSEAGATEESSRALAEDRSDSLEPGLVEAERCGLMAAETAAVVPSLRAARRVILSVIPDLVACNRNLRPSRNINVDSVWLLRRIL